MAGKKNRSTVATTHSIERQKALIRVNGVEDDQSAAALANRILQSRQLAIRGNEAANVGQYAVAVRLFTDAIHLDPNDHRFFGNRSYCFDQLGQFEEALKDAEKAIKIASHWPKGHFRKGLALKGLAKYIESEGAFEQVLLLDKGCEEAQMEIINVRISRIVEMGFTEQQAKLAIKKHINVQPAVDALMAGEFRETMDDVFYSDEEDEFIPTVTKTETAPKEVKKVTPPKKDVNGWNVVGTSSSGNSIQYSAATQQKTTPPTAVVVQKVTPSKSTSPQNPKGLTSLWVGNILPEVTEKMITQVFSKSGQVTSVRLLKEKFCAFVNFADKNGAARALDNQQGQELVGQKLLIKFPDNPIVNGAQDLIIKKNKQTTVVKVASTPVTTVTVAVAAAAKVSSVASSWKTAGSGTSIAASAPTVATIITTNTTPTNTNNVVNNNNNDSKSTNKNTTKNNLINSNGQNRPKGPINGDECYFYRTTGCVFGDSCKFKHISKNKGVDRKPWQK